jgi:hypothetical protein
LIALAERHPEYALGFQDEVWWSRVTQPTMHAWAAADSALRLVEQTAPKDDPDRKALACYGLLVSVQRHGKPCQSKSGSASWRTAPSVRSSAQYLA